MGFLAVFLLTKGISSSSSITATLYCFTGEDFLGDFSGSCFDFELELTSFISTSTRLFLLVSFFKGEVGGRVAFDFVSAGLAPSFLGLTFLAVYDLTGDLAGSSFGLGTP